jgi:epoxide hydrolase
MSAVVPPFRLAIAEGALADLRRRPASTRWPQPVAKDFSHGIALSLMQGLETCWTGPFDWREQQARLKLSSYSRGQHGIPDPL